MCISSAGPGQNVVVIVADIPAEAPIDGFLGGKASIPDLGVAAFIDVKDLQTMKGLKQTQLNILLSDHRRALFIVASLVDGPDVGPELIKLAKRMVPLIPARLAPHAPPASTTFRGWIEAGDPHTPVGSPVDRVKTIFGSGGNFEFVDDASGQSAQLDDYHGGLGVEGQHLEVLGYFYPGEPKFHISKVVSVLSPGQQPTAALPPAAAEACALLTTREISAIVGNVGEGSPRSVLRKGPGCAWKVLQNTQNVQAVQVVIRVLSASEENSWATLTLRPPMEAIDLGDQAYGMTVMEGYEVLVRKGQRLLVVTAMGPKTPANLPLFREAAKALASAAAGKLQ